MTGSWQRMMTGWCWAVIVFGAVLMGAAFASTDGPTRFLFGFLGGPAPTMDAPLRFGVGLMGAVTFGWGLTILAVTSISHRLNPGIARLLWRRVAAALGAWYVVDSTISVATGFALNAVSNTILAVVFVLIVRESGAMARDPSVSNDPASARV